MSKRRFRNENEEKSVQELSASERRAQRKKERAQGGGASRSAKGLGSPWRRGVVVGVPVVAIIAVAVILLLNPFHANPPCITLQDSPVGPPGFPAKGTTDFSTTWCPQNVPTVFAVQPYLQVFVNGQRVALPSAVGQNANFTGYTCTLPIATHTTDTPNGLIDIASPWPYNYNLSAFFGVWSQSYAGAYVNATSPSQPITYDRTHLLGYTVDGSHEITLFVDNQPSSSGPTLNLDTLPFASSPYPACMGTIYGTGHSIVLSYKSTHAATLVPGLSAPTLSTGLYDPGLSLTLYDSPAPHLGMQTSITAAIAKVRATTLPWMMIRLQS